MRPYEKQFTIVRDGTQLEARLYPVFFYRNSNCELMHLVIYSDGTIDCDSKRYDIDGLHNLVREGLVTTAISENEGIYVPELVYITATNIVTIIEDEEFLKEVEDILSDLNGHPTTLDDCRAAYEAYLQIPTEDNRSNLKEAYERVPKHLAIWLLGFPDKDVPIRNVIYGEEGEQSRESEGDLGTDEETF